MQEVVVLWTVVCAYGGGGGGIKKLKWDKTTIYAISHKKTEL